MNYTYMEKMFSDKYGIKFKKFSDDLLYEIYSYSIENPDNKDIIEEMNKRRNEYILSDLKIKDNWKQFMLKVNPSLDDIIDSCKNKHYNTEKKIFMMMMPVGPRIKIRNKITSMGLL